MNNSNIQKKKKIILFHSIYIYIFIYAYACVHASFFFWHLLMRNFQNIYYNGISLLKARVVNIFRCFYNRCVS